MGSWERLTRSVGAGLSEALQIELGRIEDHPSVRVGEGEPLVFVPGLNDPLQRVTDSWWFSLLVANYCRRFEGRATYMVSRPPGIGPDRSTREMARGYADVLEAIQSETGHQRVDLVGLSMGGFVVTHLAVERPDLVDRAVLGLAADRLSDRGRRRLRRWDRWASEGQWRALNRNALDVVARGLRRWALGVVARLYESFGTPNAVDDFRASLSATLAHDAGDRLADLERPVLVVGGDGDPFFSVERFRETARRLPRGRFARLRGVSHEAPLEAPRVFEEPIREFLAVGSN